MRMFITFKNKYLSNDMKIFGTCSIPLIDNSSFDFVWYTQASEYEENGATMGSICGFETGDRFQEYTWNIPLI